MTEFSRAWTDTTTTIAAERLAVIAVATLPVTAVSSVRGLNVIVNDSTRRRRLITLLAGLIAPAGVVLPWTKGLGWW